jgi:hypothetical protein
MDKVNLGLARKLFIRLSGPKAHTPGTYREVSERFRTEPEPDLEDDADGEFLDDLLHDALDDE